jgi:sugar/nucleoside kinase (ribokinase family)
MEYIVTAWTLINDLYFADGSVIKGVLGGGVYCLAGIKPFCDDVGYVSSVGEDFFSLLGAYFETNGYTTAGLKFSLPFTRYYIVEYDNNGWWREYPVHGDDIDESYEEAAKLFSSDILPLCDSGTKGIYTECNVTEPFWHDEEIKKIRHMIPNVKIMWELPYSDIVCPEHRKRFRETLDKCDIFSVNLTEGRLLFGRDTEEGIIDGIIKTHKPCFFRCGEKGSYFINDDIYVFAPSYRVNETKNPTGCGNCATAAALFGFCESFDPLKIAAFANVAAYYNALQIGPFCYYSNEIKSRIKYDAAKYYEFLKKENNEKWRKKEKFL